MPRFALVNMIIIAISMTIMLIIYIQDLGQSGQKKETLQNQPRKHGKAQKPSVTYLDYHSSRSAYWYFFGALTWVFISYLLTQLDGIGKDWSEQAKQLLHVYTHSPKIFLSNLANVSLLIAAFAYGLGKDFDSNFTKKLFAISAILIAIWCVFWELVDHEKSLLFTMLLIAPDVVLSILALILLGWVFVSRWSGVGVAYFIIMILYAIFQLPARIAVDLKGFLDPSKPLNLEPTFYLLAAGKIFVVGGFIFMLRKTTDDIDQPRLWPTGPRSSPYPLHHVVLALVGALVAPFIIDWGKEVLANTMNP
jgi:hypothetical protein